MRQQLITFAMLALCVAVYVPQDAAGREGEVFKAPRTQLTVEQLQGTELLPMIDMSFFAEPDWATGEPAAFTGTLILSGAPLEMREPVERDVYQGEHIFPAVRIGFVPHDGQLIPRETGIIDTREWSDSFWDVIVGTGAYWREEGDDGWSRASFPVHLVDRYIGQVRNCVGTFVYDEQEVSNVAVQCSQESADVNAEQLSNIRAMVPADYERGAWHTAASIISLHEQRVANRFPVAPLSEIDADGKISAYFDKRIWTEAPTSLGAVYMDGTLYAHPPVTRHGVYPYPDEMRYGVYSTTKSMAGALAMFYFAERYGEEIFDALITDYVPGLADANDWQGVTFSHALNMATGTPVGEEATMLLEPLILADTAEEAIANIAGLGAWPEGPGEKFTYGSTNTFVLSYALQNYVEEREGPGVPYWDLVHKNVLVPIGADDFDLLRTRGDEGTSRIPSLAYGAFPTRDNAAKIAALIADEGEFEGRQLLNRNKIREALGRTNWQGYPTPEFWSKRYRHSLWETPVQAGLFCRIDVPFMLGYGANHTLFLPSGIVVFRYMDEQNMDIKPLVRAVEAVRSSCG
ncbi:serine hydrolase [Parvularcula flava]|uniref:Serine hydrolase n=1 Tax=Aquisalinus luteolus TaxID=1566827 RepID=A0A8J3ERJ5_9PROT|nr:serine hydrolase [Aquisalinus luteolus]NHK28841.1 serine hydrolase [Aquisalinus luteolus]GGH99678.1 hypothetical protein GCM10011355_26200 [Aquisalinus luteolus]